MMNENSPICARLSPLITEVFSVAPVRRAPNPQNSERPMMATKAMTTMAPRFSVTARGVTSMPTDTKNTAPNRSLMGLNSASTRFACSAGQMDLARNAQRRREPDGVGQNHHPHAQRDGRDEQDLVVELGTQALEGAPARG